MAFGGAFYAYLDAASVGLSVEPGNVGALIDAGRRIKQAVQSVLDPVHPEGGTDLNFLYGVIFSQAG